MTLSSKKTKNGYPKGIFREIFVCPKQELSPYGTAFAFGAENFDSRKLGTIFGVIKLDDRSEDSSYIANLLVSVMKKEYFSKPQRSAEESFEASLRKANLALAELARHGSLGWSGKINFACGALERNNLHFACLGKVSAFLFRGGQIAEISRDLQEDIDMETHPLKTFSNISSGKLEKEDKLIFSTNDLVEIFSKEELRQNAAHFSREEFPGFIEMSLGANTELAGTVVVDLVEALEAKPVMVEAPIIGREKISPVPAYAPEERKVDSFVGAREPKPPAVAETFPSQSEISPSFRQKAGLAARNVLFLTSAGAKKLFLKFGFFIRRPEWRDKLKRVDLKKPLSAAYNSSKKAGQSFSAATSRVRSLDGNKKKAFWGIISGIIVIVAIVLVVSAVRNKKPSPPAASVPESPQPQTTLALEDTASQKIDNLAELASFSQEESRIVLLNNSLFAVSGKDNKITAVKLDTGATEEASSNVASGNFELIAAMPDLNSIFVLTGDRKIISFTPINKNFQENGINLPGSLKSQDIRTYLTYLYVLDTANSQVYRYPRAEGGFGDGQNWLRATSDLKSAKGIAINDDLYLAASDGVTAYLQGKKDDKINFESPETPLSIDRIYSEPGMDFVWILDNTNHRVVAYSKDGKISAQYLNESISDVKDFAVDEKNKTVYLLQANSVKKFSTE